MKLTNEYHFPRVIDNTIRESFFRCPTKAQLGHFYSLSPGAPSVHLHAGGAFAAGLEAARKAFYEQGLAEFDAISRGVEALGSFYGDFEAPDYGSGSAKTRDRMIEALDAYFRQWPMAEDRLQPMRASDGRRAIEFTFAFPILDEHGVELRNPETGDPLLYGGRFDMLGVYDGQALFAVDEKTTSALGQQWTQQWDMNSQFTGYCAAAQSYGYPVAGAIIRGIGLLKTETKFAQAITYRPQWVIERWHAQLVRDVKRMIEAYNSGEFDMALGGACGDYGGCAYKTVCSTNDPQPWIELGFSRRVWDPLLKVGEAI